MSNPASPPGAANTAAGESPFRVVHVGDLHFWSLRLGPMDLTGKRVLGWGNLLFGGRKNRFRMEEARPLAGRLRDLRPDWLLFSGDFSSTSRREEFQVARTQLLPAAREAGLAVYTPGNHDAYTRRDLRRRTFAQCMGEEFHPVLDAAGYMGGQGVGLLAINATTSNGLGAHGKFTARHLEVAQALLGQWGSSLRLLLVLCHFPPEDPPGVLPHDRGLQLREAQPFLTWLTESVAAPKFWLHGHHHYRWLYASPSVPGLVYLNAGAPLQCRKGGQPDLGFHELEVADGRVRTVRTHFRDSRREWHQRETEPPEQPGRYINLQDIVPE